MNYASRALLAAIAALTMLGGGAGAALADDKHGPDKSHGEDTMTPPPIDPGPICDVVDPDDVLSIPSCDVPAE